MASYLGNYEDVFDHFGPVQDVSLLNTEVRSYRTKTIKSGNVLEVECYPIWSTASMKKKAKKHRDPEVAKRYNDEQTKKRLVRKINANFTEKDLFVTLTYDDDYVPSEDEARKDISSYLLRVKRWRKKHGMSDLKYVAVIEFGKGDRRRKKVHHHIIMSDMDRDVAENLWPYGRRSSSHLRPDDYRFTKLTRYITKETSQKGGADNRSKRYSVSRNLDEPKEQTSDRKLSRRRAAKLAQDCTIKAGAIFTKLFPGYKFLECDVKTSSFVSGAYIHAQLVKETVNENRNSNTKRSGRTDHAAEMGRIRQEHPSGTESPVPYPKRR